MNYLLERQESDRLVFRELQEEDFETWIELFYDEEVSKYLGMDKINTPEERCQLWFSMTFNRYNKNLGGQNALIDKKTNKLIGQSGLLVREIDGKKELEVAYSILPKYRKLGFATEAAKKCADFAFSNKLASQLISIIHTDNIDSEGVALNIGMKKLGSGIFNGMQVNFWGITAEEWK